MERSASAAHRPMRQGETARRIRDFDWSATPLGAVHRWPQSLTTVVELMLATAQPVSIGWGPDPTPLDRPRRIGAAGTTPVHGP